MPKVVGVDSPIYAAPVAVLVARINRPYEDSGYVISDPVSWDTNAGKDQAKTG